MERAYIGGMNPAFWRANGALTAAGHNKSQGWRIGYVVLAFAPPAAGAVDMNTTLEFDLDSVDLEADADLDLEQDQDTVVEARRGAKKTAGKGANMGSRKVLTMSTMSKKSSNSKQLQVLDTMVPG